MRHALVVFLLGFGAPALAVTQPNGTVIPAPAVYCNSGAPGGLGALFACQCSTVGACNIGATCPGGAPSCDDGKHSTCETTIWHVQNDNSCIPSLLSGLDPVADARTTPETFHPTCGLTFTVVSRGTALFHSAFGWYNVTGSKPQPSDLHVMLDCHASGGASLVLDVRNDPAYKGGDIGFFLVTPEDHAKKGACAGGDCCATVARAASGAGYIYYSQPSLNPDNGGAASVIHLLTYDSKVSQHKFYFAWEDIFGGNDDEFTDLVTSVEGVECGGAGGDCDTGKKGICAAGIIRCDNGALSCVPLTTPQPSKCNGLDNDCDGVVDDGPCDGGNICVNGECVPRCTAGEEFPCPAGLTCDSSTGTCKDPSCGGVSCPRDQICRGGSCKAACDGIVCPHGIACRNGACVDPCKGVACAPGQVCAGGYCLPGCNACGGVACAAPTSCDSSTGACSDASCPMGCPTGTYCDHGACKDSCAGAVCPAKHQCVAGQCVPATGPSSGGGGDGGSGGAGGAGGGSGNGLRGGCSGCAAPARQRGGTSGAFVLLALVGLGIGRARVKMKE